ncbi:cupin domain-containing protein [Polaromonas sp. JS666]|uniref:cupin domain-containing protein n=1 Tax=Polaromonas sp. (strain JS666 / ATCC BAA-500) TaxID=296591 RepID=UPI0000536BD2|nr:cupin domain-containing protein [Polaromonas sp. JS666]ABE42325.1 Cupin 2, conserved barrel [Polaromonas sp. JS666]
MNVTRISGAPAYFPPHHEAMHCLRLQGHEAGLSESVWLGMSYLLPGGGTSLDASSVEKHYVVLEGEVTVSTEADQVVLKKYDSCRLAAGEKRALANRTNFVACILLAMPYPR